MEVIVEYKRWLDSYRDIYMLLLLIKWWLVPNYVHSSFNFNLNGVEEDSIISKQFSVLSALQVSLLTTCEKNATLLIRLRMFFNPC